LNTSRLGIARVDGNAARVAGASTGSASDQGKVARIAMSELGNERISMEPRGDASDIDGQNREVEWDGAHEST
jgi:hypothetical protein